MEKRMFELLMEKSGFDSFSKGVYEFINNEVVMIANLNEGIFKIVNRKIKYSKIFKIFDEEDMDVILDSIEYWC